MNMSLRKTLSFCSSSLLAALLVVPNVAQAQNTVLGTGALLSNTSGNYNTALGLDCLYYNTTGALFSTTTGNYNTATGGGTLNANTTGDLNTATGYSALFANSTGVWNTANGFLSLYGNTTGNYNTADGSGALSTNTAGSYNIAIGNYAGQNITGSYNIAIGNSGNGSDSGVIRIGTSGNHNTAFIAGINGVTASGGVAVYINAQGQLGTLTSSRRFKNQIKSMGSVSEQLMQLRPVTFRYRDSAERGQHALQYGLIAEEVAKVYPNLVQYDKAGKPFTVYYHLLTPMLLNELQKEHQRNVAQRLEVKALMAEMSEMKVTHTTELAALHAELASLKLAQQQQTKLVAKLAALLPTSKPDETVQRVAMIKH